jgi:succinate dehydrogenase flavin-adding protein (antitoxin of CptAB toxin-antitoxin module)
VILGRTHEMFELVKNICQGHRLIQLLAMPGMGKSILARKTLNYISDRKIYQAGMIFVNIKGVRELDRLIREFAIKVYKKVTGTQTDSTVDPDSIINQLIEAINKQSKHKKHFLIAVDNAEDIISFDEKAFRMLIARLLNECKNLGILLTSRMPLVCDAQQGKLQLLYPLKPMASVELFLERTPTNCDLA